MKFADLPATTRDGHRCLEVENAVVSRVSLTIADHGVLCGWLHLEMDGSGCGFGGYVLDKIDPQYRKRGPIDYTGEFIIRCLKTVGVERWEDLEGCALRCLSEGLGGGIVAIGNLLKDDWFCPRAEWKEQP